MKRLILSSLILSFALLLNAQRSDTLQFNLHSRLNAGLGKYAPFLSSANQWDRFGITPNSLSIWGNLSKEVSRTRFFDYGFGAELNTNFSPTEFRWFPGELFAEAKVGTFLIDLGMKREVFGNQDAELSSGGMIASSNSRPIPALTIETDGWIEVPWTKGYLAFKGGMINGWFDQPAYVKDVLLHHKWLHFKLGAGLPITANLGLHHVAQWAGNMPGFGAMPVTFDDFVRVFFGKSGSASAPANEFFNSLGNHMISQQVGLGLHLRSFDAEVYWQNLSEDGPVYPIYKTYNQEDGLWGLSLRMPKFKPLHSLAVEFLSTTDQSGPWHDLDGIIYGGLDQYYNNGLYPDGWSNYGMTIGNPWLTSPKYNPVGLLGIRNNAVRLFYLSGMGEVDDCNYRLTTAYSLNWGFAQLERTAPKRQFSGQLEVFHALPFWKQTEFSLGLSGDLGTQYGNNLAFLMGLRYTGQFITNHNH